MLKKFETKKFRYQDRDAYIIYPPVSPNGKLMLKTEYLHAFPDFEAAMLERGYTLCFLSHPTRWAPDSETEIMASFVTSVARELEMEPKVIAIGMSCGGLQAVRLAQLHPELISVLYLDAPVLNILSMAGLGACTDPLVATFRKELEDTYGFTPTSLVNFRKSPIDALEILTDNKIPVILLYGDADTVVLYEENGKVLEEHYRKHGGDIEVFCRVGGGHHPHSLKDPTPIIDFVECRV